MNRDTSTDFLESEETLQQIASISQSRSLAIYCGAGATIDQTGLNWDELVKKVFQERKSNDPESDDKNRTLESLLESKDYDYQQKASIVLKSINTGTLNETNFLSPILQKMLYRKNSWSQGLLLENISLLAVEFASRMKNVTIATTNYDDYLVVFIACMIGEISEGAEPGEPTPGLKITVLGESTVKQDIIAPKNDAPSIHIIFLHGLISNSNSISIGKSEALGLSGTELERQIIYTTRLKLSHITGDIVFSELSYAKSQIRTTSVLSDIISTTATFLCLGSSLTDPPLVSALCNSMLSDPNTFAEEPNTYAVVKSPSLKQPQSTNKAPIDSSSDVRDLIAGRMRGIGVKNPLFASNYYEIGQFIEEIRSHAFWQDLVPDQADSYYENTFSYKQRIDQWHQGWVSWHENLDLTDEEEYEWRIKEYQSLSNCLNSIRAELTDAGFSPKSDELLRIRCWVVDMSSDSSISRRLILVANSAGVIMDDTSRPFQNLNSSSPAAMAFNSGRPIISQISNHANDGSRWKCALAVPIFQNIELAFPDTDEVMQGCVAVGAVTLESTLNSESIDQINQSAESVRLAAFCDPRIDSHLLTSISKELSDNGVAITSPV